MKLKLLNSCLIRTPRLSYQHTLEQAWPRLKEAIGYSSKAFYQIIKDLDYEDINKLDAKARYTIWKYFNRARYRATPYGYFGSCSTAEIDFKSEASPIVIAEVPEITSFTDWPRKNDLQFDEAHYFAEERIYSSNGSIYYTADSIRYIYRHDKLFELTSIDRDELIEGLLTFCRHAVSFKKLAEHLETTAGLSLPEVKDLVIDLVAHQLLYTDLSPNIIGPDYFQRNDFQTDPSASAYILSERKVIEGSLQGDYFRHFNDCVACLLSCAEEVKPQDLETFKGKFKSRFEDQEIPLLKALDPELGIGYGNLAQADQADDVYELMAARNGQTIRKTAWGRLEMFLFQNMMAAGNHPGYIIRLEDFEGDKAKETGKTTSNTFSALVNVYDDQVVIENIGGCTATALLGRFTMNNPKVKKVCRELVGIEAEANPDVIFFDIGYLSEDQVDNINRREAIYKHELPVLVYSCSESVVQPEDIRVSVRNDEVILYSGQYGKRLIPRLSTAYNYHRSDLSLYRFLCDLQQQGITSQLNIDLRSKFPGAKFYPRLQYKNIVLSPAKWLIETGQLKHKSGKDLIEASGAGASFKIRNNDQTLHFNLNHKEDLEALNHYVKQQKKDFYIEESFMPEGPLLRDEQQNPYLPQLVLSFYHTNMVYKGISPGKTTDNSGGVAANILPGNDWLYFEIYCHPQSSNSLLTEKLEPLIQAHAEAVQSWFFIRYLNPAYHLRFRLQLKPETDSYAVIKSFSGAMKDWFDDGKIVDIQLKPYKREIERYGADLIERIESHFCVDSRFVLAVLAGEWSPSQIYHSAVQIGLEVLQALGTDLSERLSLAEFYLNNFIREHQWTPREFKKLNSRYSSFQKLKTQSGIEGDSPKKQQDLTRSFTRLLQDCSESRQKKLFGDLFHMLINRLFAEHQRIHEGVIYYFMVKELERCIRTEKHQLHSAISQS